MKTPHGTSVGLLLTTLADMFRSLYRRGAGRIGSRGKQRELRLCESVSLGEKRFVAVIEVGAQRFLIGGTNQSVTLLGRLRRTPPSPDFAQLLANCEMNRVM